MAETPCYPSAASPSREEPRTVNPFLAVGQIVVSIGLMFSILLQARGAGLSSAFGGDSSVYRSRRGIEKTLYRFTVVLTAVFVVFSIAAFLMTSNAA